jgi:hypothetical protein
VPKQYFAAMSKVTFEQFKLYFKFELKVASLLSAVAAAAYKLNVAKAF